MKSMSDTRVVAAPTSGSGRTCAPTPRARRHRLRRHTRGDGGHHPRRCACPGRRRRLRGPRWWRDDSAARVRRGDRRLLGRGHRHCRRSSSLERSPRPAIRADGSDADRDLVGPAPPLRGKHRHHHRPRRATPRRRDGDDPDPGVEPPHPDRFDDLLRRGSRTRPARSHIVSANDFRGECTNAQSGGRRRLGPSERVGLEQRHRGARGRRVDPGRSRDRWCRSGPARR